MRRASARFAAVLAAMLPAGCDGPGSGLDCVGFLQPDEEGCSAAPWLQDSPVALSEPGASGARVGLDADQQPLVGWLQGGAEQVDIRAIVAEPREGEWFSRALGSSANGFADDLELSVGSSGQAVATWTQHRVGAEENAVFVARRSERGGWDPGLETNPVSFDERASQSRALVAPTGEALVVWNQGTTTGYGVAVASALGSDALTRPADRDDVISPPLLFSNAPQLAVGSNGDALITWYQSVGAELRVFVSERRGVGEPFSKPAAKSWISPPGPPVASHAIRNPVAAIGARGEGLVVWAQVHPSGATGLYLATRDGLGRWTFPQDIDDTFAPLATHASCAGVTITASGEAFVTWYDGPPGATSAFAARRDAQGNWDERWPAAEVISTGGAALDPQLASGSDGETVVVWAERVDEQWAIFGRRRNPHATVWSDPVRISREIDGDALAPAVAVEAGTTAIAWEQGPFGETRVFAAVSSG